MKRKIQSFLHNSIYEWFLNSSFYYLQNSNPDSIFYNNQPKYNIYQQYDYYTVYDNIISETITVIGQGFSTVNEVFNSQNKSGRTQYIISASELISQGVVAGPIDKLTIDITSSGEELNNVVIRMKPHLS